MSMTLREYLKTNGIQQEKFIEQVHAATGRRISQGGLSKYVMGWRIPRKEEMLAIHKATDGAVQPNDFYL